MANTSKLARFARATSVTFAPEIVAFGLHTGECAICAAANKELVRRGDLGSLRNACTEGSVLVADMMARLEKAGILTRTAPGEIRVVDPPKGSKE